jgi:antitoxin CcdA
MRMSPFDETAPKKAVNLSVNGDLLAKARALGLNLSGELEQRLADAVRRAEREAWMSDNRNALDDHNRRVEERGLFSDGKRQF